MIERRIVAALIKSTSFLKQIEPIFQAKLLDSEEARRIAGWCLSYFRKYEKAPKKEIQNIYLSKSDSLNEETASLIESTLDNLAKDFRQKIEIDPLIDETELYLKKRQIQDFLDEVDDAVENDDIEEAEKITNKFEILQKIDSKASIPLSDPEQIRKTFDDQFKPLFSYGDTPLGNMLNRKLCRGCFVALMAPNKSAKSFWLNEMAMRAVFNGSNVVFFQAGDMSEAQQMRRQGIYLTKKSDLFEYCNELYVPVLDCVYNQNNECDLADRESDIAPLESYSTEQIRNEADSNNITTEDLKMVVDENPDHSPCYNCIRTTNRKYHRNFKGTIWYKKRAKTEPLGWKEVYRMSSKFRKKLDKMRLITYSNETLSVSLINKELDLLEKKGFKADVIVIDYMDIMATDKDTRHMQPRDQENKKWQRIRSLSTERNILVLGATQADAKSFTTKLLSKSNFSEDKRKLDHTTDTIGLNMTEDEKIKGIIRLNSIVSRETEGAGIVYVLHRLQIGRPVLGSFY